MRTRCTFLLGVLGSTLLVFGGCYSQRPLESLAPKPETRIVARVTDSGVVAMANAIGPSASEVEGLVTAADENVWRLNLLRVDYRGGSSVTWNGEQVSFPRFALTMPQEKKFDQRKSFLAGGVIVAAAFTAAVLFRALGADEGGEITPTPQSIIFLPGGR